MEHFNPILQGQQSPQKFITIGEVMLRLTPPNYEKIRMASSFEACYGGSEANIALALANLGVDSTFFSVVPNNSLGKSAVRWLRSNDVHCTPMILSSKEQTPTHRLGTYYLETGYGIRPSKVIYDRKHSALTEFDLSTVDLDALFDGFDWLHLSGITPALNQNCADFHPALPAHRQGEGPDRQLRRQLPQPALELGGRPGLLHPLPALRGRAVRHRALPPVERRKRPQQGRLEGRRAPAAQL